MHVRNALKGLLQAGFSGATPEFPVSFSGADPVFPTPYRVGTAGAAALGAVGAAVAHLWKLRTGRVQSVAVDLRAAAAAMRSARYLRIDGKAPELWDPLSGFYPVRDGRWVSIHCNFPVHRDAAARVLGAQPERAAMEAASRGWDGVALEDAVHAAGGCAGLARTTGEWERHPQSAAVASESLLEIKQIGDAPPQPMPEGARPLSGVRVLDLTRVLAGPTCARTLAEHGADVLRISGAHLPDSGPVELDTGIGKLQAFLDLRAPDGIEALQGLLRDADVFSQSYRPGALASKGFSAEQAAVLRPGIVYVTLNAWGWAGPWAARRGFDSIVQTVSGMAVAQGAGSDPLIPKLLPVSAIDYVSGYLMAFGALAALTRRATVGGSWHVRVSLARVGKWIVDLGTIEGFASVPAELPGQELQRLLAQTGAITHLRPVLGLSETLPYWEHPPVAPGTHPAAWPAPR